MWCDIPLKSEFKVQSLIRRLKVLYFTKPKSIMVPAIQLLFTVLTSTTVIVCMLCWQSLNSHRRLFVGPIDLGTFLFWVAVKASSHRLMNCIRRPVDPHQSHTGHPVDNTHGQCMDSGQDCSCGTCVMKWPLSPLCQNHCNLKTTSKANCDAVYHSGIPIILYLFLSKNWDILVERISTTGSSLNFLLDR